MRARTAVVIAVVAALGLIAFTGVALASGTVWPRGWMGWMGRGAYSGAQGTPAVSCPMAGGSGYYGPGGMMGGYQNGQSSAATPAVGVTHVSIQNFAFQPQVIQVSKGTTVTWTNEDSAPHTVTFRSSGMTGSSALQRGQSFSYTFTTPGTYTYFCGVHPYMGGTVIVTP